MCALIYSGHFKMGKDYVRYHHMFLVLFILCIALSLHLLRVLPVGKLPPCVLCTSACDVFSQLWFVCETFLASLLKCTLAW